VTSDHYVSHNHQPLVLTFLLSQPIVTIMELPVKSSPPKLNGKVRKGDFGLRDVTILKYVQDNEVECEWEEER